MNNENPQSVAARKAALEDLRRRRDATQVELRDAEGAVAAASEALALSGDPKAVKAFNDASSNLAMLGARLAAFDEQVIPRAEVALAEAQSAEAEAERWRLYAEAQKAGEAAAEDLRRSFEPLKTELGRLQGVLRAAEVLAHRANQNLPFGAERLRHPEGSVRDQWPRSVEILSEEEVDRWVYKSTGHVVPDAKLDRIEIRGPFDGLIYSGSRHASSSSYRLSRKVEVVKVRCMRQEVLSQARFVQGERLGKIDLGPLKVEAALEPVIRFVPLDPMLVEPGATAIGEDGDAIQPE